MNVIATHILFHVEIQKTEGKPNCQIKKRKVTYIRDLPIFSQSQKYVRGGSGMEHMGFHILNKTLLMFQSFISNLVI